MLNPNGNNNTQKYNEIGKLIRYEDLNSTIKEMKSCEESYCMYIFNHSCDFIRNNDKVVELLKNRIEDFEEKTMEDLFTTKSKTKKDIETKLEKGFQNKI